jgi:hypothetical protein
VYFIYGSKKAINFSCPNLFRLYLLTILKNKLNKSKKKIFLIKNTYKSSKIFIIYTYLNKNLNRLSLRFLNAIFFMLNLKLFKKQLK